MKKQKIRVVCAGHVCLDMTPAFPQIPVCRIDELLVPGSLIQVGAADVHIGGSVANAGLAFQFFGADVQLVARVGDDAFGEMVLHQIAQHASTAHITVSSSEATSYSVVLAPHGIDRIFLHHSGANNAFCSSDIADAVLQNASLLHIGYPPVMKKLYENGARELLDIMKRAKVLGVATSLDLASIDDNADGARADWHAIFKEVLPYVDFFVPSAAELAFLIDRARFDQWMERANGRDIAEVLSPEADIAPLAQQTLEWGAKVVLVKCGARGIYVAAADKATLLGIGGGLNVQDWANIRHFEASYRPQCVVSGTGAGDSSIAAFLFAAFQQYTWQECVQLAAATGASCVEAYDALSGLRSFSALQEKIKNGWEKN